MLEERRVQTSVLYTAIHQFSAYRGTGQGLERSERASATQLTLPLYPHLTEADQDRVVAALADGLGDVAAPSSPAASARSG
jgi:dTDP-4-amino-4,6-dideoxygalactose transaminase